MATPTKTLIDLEQKFWQSMVDQDPEAATHLLAEPALMVSAHGAMKFDHAGYRRMATQGTMVVTAFEFSDMEVVFPNDATAILTYKVKQSLAKRDDQQSVVQQMHDSSTWVDTRNGWRCVMHTETPVGEKPH